MGAASARSQPGLPGRSPRFRALEYFCLLYDVAVDQEDYNGPWCAIAGDGCGAIELESLVDVERVSEPSDSAPWERERFHVDVGLGLPEGADALRIVLGSNPGELEQRLMRSAILEPLRREPVVRGCGENSVVDSFWTKLLLAKLLRALLQQRPSSASSVALDQVGLALVREAPIPSRTDSTAVHEQLRVLRWLFLNEASACYRGYHSIALADDCLVHIKKEIGPNLSPHELVALYNKAQGSLHARNHTGALGRFREVADYLAPDSTNVAYFEKLSCNPYGWPDCRNLLNAYLRVPSILQAADTLLNLQRSTDAERELAKLEGLQLSEYQRARAEVMRSRIANDLGGARREKPLFDWRSSPLSEKRGIALQSLGVEAERHAILVGERARGLHRATPPLKGETCPA